ncbi:MAG: hypothetical protein JW846_06400 [Dehalococcoidia bacterium]|nr:hypothetical protein [Dehalococcoidia bacterium]
MKLFDHMPMGEKGLREVYAWTKFWVEENRGIAEIVDLGPSEDGKWEIPAVVVTNKSIPSAEKQNAILTMGRHGKERGTRIVVPEILNYLATNDASEIRDKQTVVVVPVANPEGFVLEEFHSTLFGITDLEKRVWGKLCSAFPPDMMFDYHSLGKSDGSKFDRGDLEVIIPGNTTKWAMDEQIHLHVARKMVEAAAAEGWPYEIHTLEDLSYYYFGEPRGKQPHRSLQEKVFLLHIHNTVEDFEYPGGKDTYTNYTCAPAYARWHTLVFGTEMNHRAIPVRAGLGASGLVTCKALLHMGNSRFPWEKEAGYPTNLLVGDYRISVRAFGKNPEERRVSREKIWADRASFSILNRDMLDSGDVTVAEVGYFGHKAPLDFELCLRMRQKSITRVTVEGNETPFQTHHDDCSTFVSIPMCAQKQGIQHVTVEHEVFGAIAPPDGD